MAAKERKIARTAAPAELPEGWRVVRFDEMAQLINDRVDNPSEAGVERYVGLEHLDPESLKIRRWGSPDDVEAQKLRFQPGDIIFGKRRAYQRKLAVVDFEGICSAHAMVLRAREETVVKDFLPFFMQSDTFFDCALSISVGSLSPTINWKTLASQQFAIPPKDEQHRIANILWAANETVVTAEQVQSTAKHALVISCQQLTSEPSYLSKSEWKEVPLSECADILDNLRRPLSQDERSTIKGDIPYYGANGQIDSINDYVFDEEIVLLGEDGDHFLKYDDWPQAHLVRGKSWVNNHAHVFRARQRHCSNSWLYRFFQHRNILSYLQDSASMTRRKLTKASLEAIPVSMPDSEDQTRILAVLNHLDCSEKEARSYREKCMALRKELSNSLLGVSHASLVSAHVQ